MEYSPVKGKGLLTGQAAATWAVLTLSVFAFATLAAFLDVNDYVDEQGSALISLIVVVPFAAAAIVLLLLKQHRLAAPTRERSGDAGVAAVQKVHAARAGGARDILSTISSQINGVYVQQFLANTMSVLQSCRALAGKPGAIPDLVSAYPRRLLRKPIEDDDLSDVIAHVTSETAVTAADIRAYIGRHLNDFLETQRDTLVYGFEKLDIRRVGQEIEEKYPELYQFTPLHEPELKRIFEGEGLRVVQVRGLHVLAALVLYVDGGGNRRYAALLKEDETVPQALKEFAMAHELGHWFAHIKHVHPEEVNNRDVYLHSFHDIGPFEHEANKIALLILFPTPYLSWREVYGTLTVEGIFGEFTAGMHHQLSEPLRKNMTAFIERRIQRYKNYRRLWLEQLRLPNIPLKEKALPLLIENFFTDFGWAVLDTEYMIADANEQFAALVGLTRAELLSERRHIEQLTEPTARRTTMEQLKRKREDRVPKFYITKYKNLRNGEVIPVTIYSFPIIAEDNNYKGSFGLVTDIREGVWNRVE